MNSNLDNNNKLNIGQYAFANLKESFKLEIKNLKEFYCQLELCW
nr:hypothetical protein [Mycoplasmopsis bovis]